MDKSIYNIFSLFIYTFYYYIFFRNPALQAPAHVIFSNLAPKSPLRFLNFGVWSTYKFSSDTESGFELPLLEFHSKQGRDGGVTPRDRVSLFFKMDLDDFMYVQLNKM